MSRGRTQAWPSRRIGRTAWVTGAMALLAVGLLAPSASAAVESATLSMTSDAGDYIGQGQPYAYSTSAGDSFGSTNSARVVNVSVSAANGDWWHLDFAAPDGETLAVGTYAGATRYPFQAPTSPALAIYGNGRGCNELTGSFTVTEISFQEGGAIETFGATFEQHCEGQEPALRGEVHLANAPAPAPLTLGLGLSPTGSASRAGVATVKGTVTCSAPASVNVSGTLTQKANRFSVATGQFSLQVACSGTTPWQATVYPSASVPYNAGSAQLSATATAYDAEYQNHVSDSQSATVRLGR
jgi:hypothetical protein